MEKPLGRVFDKIASANVNVNIGLGCDYSLQRCDYCSNRTPVINEIAVFTSDYTEDIKLMNNCTTVNQSASSVKFVIL